uniref:Uncharacterized protein n=1 Tax=Theropithecus gelada TaxID=9565 RepID=A0A8D2EJD7_THEGE
YHHALSPSHFIAVTDTITAAMSFFDGTALREGGSREKPGPSRRRWAGHSSEPWRSPTHPEVGTGFPSSPPGIQAPVFISPGPSPSQWAPPCL